jgi:probable HAF family extracellular repeat protein
MKLIFTAVTALFLLPAGYLAAAPAVPQYEVVPLHSLPGTETKDSAHCEPRALNNKGECAGAAGVNARLQAVRWDAEGKIHLLSTLTRRLDEAEGINDQGQVIAYATSPEKTLAARLYVIDRMGAARLLTSPLGTETMGFLGGEAINNAGQTVFNTQDNGSLPHRAFLENHKTLTDLGHLPLRELEARFGQVNVHALNNTGMATGWSQVNQKYAHGLPFLPIHAFLWRKSVMTDLGVLPGYDNFHATALNDQGEVIGAMSSDAESQSGPDPASNLHGFLWRNGKMINLGGLPGCRYTEPTSINDKGQIVGNSYNIVQKDGDFTLSGGALGSGVFVWQNGKMQDLQTLVPAGWQLQSAVAINNRGDILCTGYHTGMPSPTLGSGAFLLRRVTPALP